MSKRTMVVTGFIAAVASAILAASALSGGGSHRPADVQATPVRPAAASSAGRTRTVRAITQAQRSAFADFRRRRVERDRLPRTVTGLLRRRAVFGLNPALSRRVRVRSTSSARPPALYLLPASHHVCMVARPDRADSGRAYSSTCRETTAAAKEGVFLVSFCVSHAHPDLVRVEGVASDAADRVSLLSNSSVVAQVALAGARGFVAQAPGADEVRIGEWSSMLPESSGC